jgi:hypothetical protein
VNGKYPPVVHHAGLPSNNIIGAINGLVGGAVLAYAGLQLFVEFLAEMRRPRDFIKVYPCEVGILFCSGFANIGLALKAMWGAQLFIYTVYVVYGCFMYYVSFLLGSLEYKRMTYR